MSTLETVVDEILRDPLAEARELAEVGGDGSGSDGGDSRNGALGSGGSDGGDSSGGGGGGGGSDGNGGSGGGRVIGYVGPDVPVELILAAGALPLRLTGHANRPTPHADRYLEAAFSPEIRSIAEQWLSGAFDFLEAVIFSRGGDSAQRLYYYLCELQRRGQCGGPKPLLYDLARVERASSRAHTLSSTLRLAAEIGTNHERLPEAGQTVARRTTLLTQLSALRLQPKPVAGSLAHRIIQASSRAWTPRFDQTLSAWLPNAPTTLCKARLLLAGSAPPDERLHTAVESGGGTVVVELNDSDPLTSGSFDSAASDSIESIAARAGESLTIARAFMNSPDALVERARAARADGVVIWLIEEDEALVWELPAQLRALTAAKIPVHTLTRQPWAAGTEAFDRVARFTQSLQMQA